jgi:hypothetical protein
MTIERVHTGAPAERDTIAEASTADTAAERSSPRV